MGFAKREWEDYIERGLRNIPDKYVCPDCVDDPGLKAYIQNNPEHNKCSYCDRDFDTNICTSLENFMNYLMDCIHKEWTSAENVPFTWDSENHEWLIDTTSKYDLIEFEEPVSEKNQLLVDDITSSIESEEWLPMWLEEGSDNFLFDAWTEFTRILQHKIRFTIYNNAVMQHIMDDCDIDHPDPFRPLSYINDTIISLNMITYYAAGEPIFRARKSETEEVYARAEQMGTKKSSSSDTANRMSPVGISMFYGAFNEYTAAKEIKYKPAEFLHIGKFCPINELLLIDFTKLPDYPSIYEGRDAEREKAKFIYKFAESLSKPLLENQNEHIEYIPTQVLTEYLRYNFSINGRYCDGIIYRSSYRHEKCCVLFVDPEHCIDKDISPRDPGCYLILEEYKRYDP